MNSKFYALHKEGSVLVDDQGLAWISQREKTLFDSKEEAEEACAKTFEQGEFQIFEIRRVSTYTRYRRS